MDKKWKFWFSFFALVFIVAGWFFDKSEYFNFLHKSVCPSCEKALRAIDYISLDSRRIITTLNPEFKSLINAWPDLGNKNAVVVIGRSVTSLGWGSNDKKSGAQFQLIAYNDNCALVWRNSDPTFSNEKRPCAYGCCAEIRPRWTASVAREFFESKLNFRLFLFGAMIFLVGIGIDAFLIFVEGRDIFYRKQ